jgi:hypothetical protein
MEHTSDLRTQEELGKNRTEHSPSKREDGQEVLPGLLQERPDFISPASRLLIMLGCVVPIAIAGSAPSVSWRPNASYATIPAVTPMAVDYRNPCYLGGCSRLYSCGDRASAAHFAGPRD